MKPRVAHYCVTHKSAHPDYHDPACVLLTEPQARMLAAVQAGPRIYNDRARSRIERLEKLGLVDVDWDADLDSQKSRLRWRITVTAKEQQS
jgi:hypothetical protein